MCVCVCVYVLCTYVRMYVLCMCVRICMYEYMYVGNFQTSCTYHSQLLSPVASSYRTVLHKTPVNSVQQ